MTDNDLPTPDVSNRMPGDSPDTTSNGGAAPSGDPLDRSDDVSTGSGGDSLAGDDMLGATGPDTNTSASKDPSDWVTGDEPMTGAQRSYLDTLAREAGEEISANLTKAEASEQIERLQQATGRGQ